MEKKLANALGEAPVGLMLLSTELVVEWVNSAMSEQLRVPIDQLVGQNLLVAAPPLVSRRPIYERALAGEWLSFPNAEVAFPDGPRTFRVRYQPTRGESNEVTGLLVSAEEVTAQALAEKALQAANARLAETSKAYERLFAHAREMLVAFNPKTLQVERVNAAIERVLGFEPAEIEGRHLETLVSPDSQPALHAALKVFSESGFLEAIELKLRARDANPVAVVLTATAVRGDSDEVHYCFASFTDVSRQRAADRERADANRFLDAVVENIPDMIFVKEARNLSFVRLNRAGEALIGVERTDMYGRSDYDFFPKREADFFTAKDRDVLASGQPVDIPEESLATAKGKRILHTRKVPIHDSTGRPAYLLGISEDITQRKEAEAELEARTKALERSNEELRQFAYVASHDLQEPLRAISGFAELLAEQYDEALDERGRAFTGRILGDAQRMSELIRDLLDYARVQTRRQAFEPVSMEAVVHQALDNLSSRISAAGATVEQVALPQVLGDATQLLQLMQNLLGNAIKFAGDEPPRITVTAKRTGDMLFFSVKDNGIGVSEESRKLVFQVFRRAVGRSEFEGTGIGLAICARVVERHGGQIWVDPNPDAGSNFQFTLPDRLEHLPAP